MKKKVTLKILAAALAIMCIFPVALTCVSASDKAMSYEYWYSDNNTIAGTLRRLATYHYSNSSTGEHYVQSLIRIEVTSSAPYTMYSYTVYSTAYYTDGTNNRSSINTGIGSASSSTPFYTNAADARAYYNANKTVSSISGHGEMAPYSNPSLKCYLDISKIAGVDFIVYN